MGNSGGLQTNLLPKVGSAMGLDQLAQAFVLQELETLQHNLPGPQLHCPAVLMGKKLPLISSLSGPVQSGAHQGLFPRATSKPY